MTQHTLTVSDRELDIIRAALLLWKRTLLHESNVIEWEEAEVSEAIHVKYWKPGAKTL